ncbi:MAG: exodeoxyribonuclease VII small subunit [Ignavibacteria bacterium]|nr:exodeoxyribonuclease VII small subunit [Ignavibacteria bacterium]
MSAKKNEKTFESALKRLESIVDSLESGSVPLDRAMDLYEEGVELAKWCGQKLQATEIRLKKLSKSVEGRFEETDGDA